jgi:predicted MFS family arabinose efflux permease
MRELFRGRRGRVAAGLLVAELSAATQGLVIAAIMPRIAGDFHALGEYALPFAAFFCGVLLIMPFAGPWADRYGTRRIFAIGLTLLAAGLASASLAPSMPAFVAARFVEGIGGGIDFALTFAVIARTFDESLRPRMFAAMSGAWVLPALAGPGLGAFVATVFGWRWAFAGFLPLVAAAALLLIPAIDDTRSEERVDPFASLRLLFSKATLRVERGLHASLAAFLLAHAAFLGADAYVALLLTGVRGLSLESASWCITLAALGWCGAAFAQPALFRRFGAAALVGYAGVVVCLATAGLTAVALGAPLWVAFAAWPLGGTGVGLAYSTISLVALACAAPGKEGTISSATALTAIVGMLLGILACGIPVFVAGHGAVALGGAIVYTFAIGCVLSVGLIAVAPRLRRPTG